MKSTEVCQSLVAQGSMQDTQYSHSMPVRQLKHLCSSPERSARPRLWRNAPMVFVPKAIGIWCISLLDYSNNNCQINQQSCDIGSVCISLYCLSYHRGWNYYYFQLVAQIDILCFRIESVYHVRELLSKFPRVEGPLLRSLLRMSSNRFLACSKAG